MLDDFSCQLKQLRQMRGWTQLDLARELKVNQTTVSRWESGVAEPVGLYAGIRGTVAQLIRMTPQVPV